ncbi:DUF6544 family protein [Flagellimonas sp. CMM7]|uniref:DUF6544 family protein n=1 Tax=Flagellimonas sp. CMM7 TaxID=2654676 RepID=UPI0013D14625|nr:DUF6544 family protein [Flagellimonas sp. CMM7]UII79969.1 hypothetical protein LV704_00260 [Flagellimonas sp. CMM7]
MMALIIVLFVFTLVLYIFYGYYRFNTLVEKDKEQLFNLTGNSEKLVTKEDLAHLPNSMKNYLIKVGVIGKCKDCHAIIKQSGQIKQKQNGKWTDFTAKQFMTAKPVGFVWAAKAFPVFVKDKSIEGVGEVNISFLGLKSIAVNQSTETDESALGRCLGELAFYPVGFLNNTIVWKDIDENLVKATIIVGDTTTEGFFHFDENGLIDRFESKRYKDETLENFTGKVENYQIICGLYIPTKIKAIWNLKSGDFEYFNCDIVDYRIE